MTKKSFRLVIQKAGGFISQRRHLSMSILAGLLMALSWPANGIPVLIFVAFVPLLFLENEVFTHRQHYNRYYVLLFAWLSFALLNLLTTWWIIYASFVGFLLAMILNSFFMALAFYLMHMARRILPGKQGAASLLIFWLSFEYLHLDWDLSWSWLNLGNVFATIPSWIQWYEYTGTLGGTAWIIVVNLAMYHLISSYITPLGSVVVSRNLETVEGTASQSGRYIYNIEQYRLIKRRIFSGLIVAVLLVAPLIISLTISHNFKMPNNPVEVVVVQPARDPYLRPETERQLREWTDSLILLAGQKITPQTRFVLVPEASLPGSLWLNESVNHYGYRRLKDELAKQDTLAWIAGVMMYKRYNFDETPSATARRFKGSDSWYDVYNAALYMDTEGNTDTYFKSKLVPGVEQFPFGRWLGPVGKIAEALGGTSGSMGYQETRSVFTGPDSTKVAPVICYESIYGEYLADYIQNGAQLIFVITNDGWWRKTPGYRQHQQYARLRAVETRRSIARAAKTGISSFIGPKGEILERTHWWEKTAISRQLHKDDRITFYVKNGDYIGRLAFFLLILFLAYMITQGFLRWKNPSRVRRSE